MSRLPQLAHAVRGLALLAALALVATACGSSNDADSAGDSSGTRTVQHRFGTVKIPAQPKRIVAIGSTDLDVLLALGVKPVATVPPAPGFSKTRFYPWVNDRPDMAGVEPLRIDTNAVADVESVAGFKPDLIVFVNAYLDPKPQYDRLSALAPVLAAKGDPVEETWQDHTRHIGAALGLADKAEQVVSDVEGKVRRSATDNPAFAGKALTFVGVFTPTQVQVVFGERDYTRKFLADLGFRVPPRQTKELPPLATDGIGTQVAVGLERLDILDADVLVAAFSSPEVQRSLEGQAAFAQLPVVKESRYVRTELVVAAGLRLPSPLSVPYVVDKLVPALRTATT